MPALTEIDIAALQAEIAELSRRLAELESGNRAAPSAPPVLESIPEAITEEELIAVSGAIAAYLGVRAHIRQIRLLSSNAWAQQGRVSIQASHRLQG